MKYQKYIRTKLYENKNLGKPKILLKVSSSGNGFRVCIKFFNPDTNKYKKKICYNFSNIEKLITFLNTNKSDYKIYLSNRIKKEKLQFLIVVLNKHNILYEMW